MRPWQFWWQTFVISIQYNPPQFVELIMLAVSVFLLVAWAMMGNWPYLVLSLSYIIGASMSVLIRETFSRPRHLHATQITATLLLILSLYSLADLLR